MWFNKNRARLPSEAIDAMRTRALCSMRACKPWSTELLCACMKLERSNQHYPLDPFVHMISVHNTRCWQALSA